MELPWVDLLVYSMALQTATWLGLKMEHWKADQMGPMMVHMKDTEMDTWKANW